MHLLPHYFESPPSVSFVSMHLVKTRRYQMQAYLHYRLRDDLHHQPMSLHIFVALEMLELAFLQNLRGL
jgi:hypothetical protein